MTTTNPTPTPDDDAQALKDPARAPQAPDDPTPGTDEPQAAPQEAPQAPDGDSKPARAREAARYRRQLRAAENERDALRDRVTALQRADVERIAATTLDKPAGLWAAGTELADLLDDAGQVDEDRVREAATAAADALGLARKPLGGRAPLQGRMPQHRGPSTDFAAAFTPRED